MSNPVNSQSQKRKIESLAPLFQEGPATVVLLKSSSDVGVMRNGGRNGARFAPQSLLSFFKKLNQSESSTNHVLLEKEVSDQAAELRDFAEAQSHESKLIGDCLRQHPKASVVHIGGGHDHIYPLLKTFSNAPKVIVINIDAHADTRTDDDAHSGTPFRQFAREYQGEYSLYQIGLHAFANSVSTLTKLEKGNQKILWREDLNDQTKVDSFFTQIKKEVSQDTVIVFSLDADALAGDSVPGVSAVNGNGISIQELMSLWQKYLELSPARKILGIYELNPVYDSLSGISMRTISAFLYQALWGK